MNAALDLARMTEREPSRSRFRFPVLLLVAAVLTGCSNNFGLGITELPADRGWLPLPIGAWVLNDGLDAKAMAICPRATCTRQGFAALLTLQGPEADALERTLATDPARLARDFAKPPKAKTAKAKPAATAPKPTAPKSVTTVTRYAEGDAQGLLVEIRALADGKRAFTAILSARSGATLTIALGVSTEPDAARTQARAAWHDR